MCIRDRVSHPQYDPNTLSTHDGDAARAAGLALNADPTRPLVNRAISGNLYPPGSVFKLITAATVSYTHLTLPTSDLV